MKTKLIPPLALAVILLLGNPGSLSAVEPAPGEAALAGKLLTALEKSDYDAFVADGDATFRQMRPEQFAAAAAHFAPMFKAGYAVTYLGDLKQGGAHVTLWKLSFKDQGDDVLANLVVKDGKVAGFWIKK